MDPIHIITAVEQVTSHLKNLILDEQIQDEVPGVLEIANSLKINHKTASLALKLLEKEGLVKNQGPRRKRLVNRARVSGIIEKSVEKIRFGVLLYESLDRWLPLVAQMESSLNADGHIVTYLQKTLVDSKMDLGSIMREARKKEVDAWMVLAGPREILEWFSQQGKPVFALYGRRANVKIASVGPQTEKAVATGVERLLALGHRKIVMVSRSERRYPNPGSSERVFLSLLKKHGIPVGDYHLPAWVETAEGLQELLRSLFLVTPPTALILGEPSLAIGAWQFCSEQGLKVPRDVSLISMASDRSLDWCSPAMTCVDFDTDLLIQRIRNWAGNVAAGRADFEQSNIVATLEAGGTVGPALLDSK